MGRRALRRPDAELDLSRHLRTLDTRVETGEALLAAPLLKPPFDQTEVFGRIAPLEIEVGSGKGLFLSAAADTTPDHNYLGIEIATKYAQFAAARLASKQLANACLLHGDAWKFFRDFLTVDSIEAVHVYFPDPWWKARHRKRRVMNEPFLLDVVRVLRPGGRLHFWTDVEEYYLTTLELMREKIPLAGPFPVSERPAEHDLDYRTHFERRMRMHGESVYRSEFEKPAQPKG